MNRQQQQEQLLRLLDVCVSSARGQIEYANSNKYEATRPFNAVLAFRYLAQAEGIAESLTVLGFDVRERSAELTRMTSSLDSQIGIELLIASDHKSLCLIDEPQRVYDLEVAPRG